ncbi:conserved hypothetical protein [Pseudomonas sp. OF001]|uniref:hypothetical protein n=1 Tax=Pseudomonas sp. OF001 TaxID=2772300 RepID=UPI001917FDF2|nr:hypothetical protein [Pseudomonas sp. OF001]CAD5378485.1 conserved hypothetical protein [Pseudomonas sp. OF001]
MQIVQTAHDLEALRAANPVAYREQLERLLGASVVRSNVAEYPDDYDHSLQPGDAGYIAPQWQDHDDLAVIQRFGFADRDALEVALAEAEA